MSNNLSPAEESIITKLVEQLQSPDDLLSSKAARQLQELGAKIVPYLVSLLQQSASPHLCWELLFVLGSMRKQADAAVPVLIDFLREGDQLLQARAASTLGLIGSPAAVAAVPALETLLTSDSELLRLAAAKALRQIAATSTTLSALVASLLDDNDFVRLEVLKLIAKLGKQAADTTPELVANLSERNSAIRSAAAEALASIGKQSIPILLQQLANTNPSVRFGALCAFEQLGETAAEVVPTLEMILLEDKDYTVRLHVFQVLASIGSAASQTIPTLLLFLDDNESVTRKLALFALGRIAQGTPELIAKLTPLLADENRAVRHQAAETLELLQRNESKHS